MITIAHLSDTHFGWKSATAGRTAQILDYVATMDPPVDVVLVTGDIADHGRPEEYAAASDVFSRWPGPASMLFLPGNHDVRAEYIAWLGQPAEPGERGRPHHRAHSVAGACFLMLDSMVPAPAGERIDHGELDAESLEWIDAALTACSPGEPAFVCLHHPPIPVHIARMDDIRLRPADALGLREVLSRHPHVKAILCGHAHTACTAALDGIPVLIGGGIASTVTLEAEKLPFITDALPPSFALHLVDDAGALVTHWRTVQCAV